ncbi:MAG: hypothetical protein EBR02_02160 [Alphaproteobacteria bacterium]|nr:hypothetical protein [Alphaproteobacteria bacterium]
MDIGGQSIGAALYEVTGGKIANQPVWTTEKDEQKGRATSRGREQHIEQVRDIMVEALDWAAHQGGKRYKVKAIGIGSPGRFDAKGCIRPGTSTNIGNPLPGGGNDLDGVNLQEEYVAALEKQRGGAPSLPSIIVNNDGSAMLAGMIDAIVSNSAGELRDQNGKVFDVSKMRKVTVADFGIGTGVGHAIAQTDGRGRLSDFKTDGHASKLWIKVDKKDLEFLHDQVKAINPKIRQQNESLSEKMAEITLVEKEDGYVRAEDLFRAPVINALAGLTAQDVKNGGGRNIAEPTLAEALQFAGKYMARTMLAIAKEDVHDVEQKHEWSAADKKEAAKTKVYLIGGDFGRKPVGAALIGEAKKEIEAHAEEYSAIKDVKMVQYTGKSVATRAAATMIPEGLLRNSPSVALRH